MSNNITNANEVNKEKLHEHEDIDVYAFVNVVFSCFNDNDASIQTELNDSEERCMFIDAKEYVCPKRVYHKDVDLTGINNAKIIRKEIIIDCNDVYFDNNGKCLEILRELYLALLSFEQLYEFYHDNIPQNAKLKMYINIMGFDILNDIPFIIGGLIDKNVPIDLKDKELQNFMLELRQSEFQEFIQEGHELLVTSIHLMQSGFLLNLGLETTNEEAREGNPTQSSNNASQIASDTPIETAEREETNKEGTTVETFGQDTFKEALKVVGSTYDFIHKFFPPFCIYSLLGGDEINDDVIELIKAYYKGEDVKQLWKKLGRDMVDYTHNTLSVLSFVPAVGSVPAIIDGYIYVIEEAYYSNNTDAMMQARNNALLSFASAIPFVKIVKHTPRILKAGKNVLHAAENIELLKRFENQSKLVQQQLNKEYIILYRRGPRKNSNEISLLTQQNKRIIDSIKRLRSVQSRLIRDIANGTVVPYKVVRQFVENIINKQPPTKAANVVMKFMYENAITHWLLGPFQNVLFDWMRDGVTGSSTMGDVSNNLFQNVFEINMRNASNRQLESNFTDNQCPIK